MPADPYVAGAVDAIREWLEAVPPQDLRRVVCAGLLVPLAEEQLAAMGYNLEGKLVGYDLAAQDWLAVLPDTEQTVDGCLCIECRTIRMKREQNSHAD